MKFVVRPDEPSFVQNAIAELQAQLGDVRDDCTIVVGREDLPPQAFVIKTVPAEQKIAIAGGDAHGTNYAVMHLRRLAAESRDGATLPEVIDVRETPRFPLRGLYLHQHWRYNHPWATWRWSRDDWTRAIDLAASMRFNLILIWPHADMMPPPFDDEAKRQLADLRAVIDHAHEKRGVKIWLVEPANVLLDQPEVRRLPMAERDYYAFAHMQGGGLKNPADPEARAALLANREELYRHVPNADGYGYIDSDPGGWIGSPSSEFVDLLAANRALLDRHHQRPREVTLFHWALAGWGNGTAQEIWRDTMTGVSRKVGEPIGFLACFANHVEIARELGRLRETLLFPYGVIDGEPSFPLTAMRFDQLERAFDFAGRYDGIGGVIGNVQTLLIQLPNIYCSARLGWDAGCAKDPVRLLRELALQLFPDDAELLAGAWRGLEQPGSAEATRRAEQIESRLRSQPPLRAGSLGQFIFPRPQIVLEDLAILLRIHAAAERMREAVHDHELMGATRGYLRLLLEWQKRNGFFGCYGVDKQVLYDSFFHGEDAEHAQAAAKRIAASEPELIREFVAAGYARRVVESMVGQLFGTYEKEMGAIEEVLFKKLPPPSETMPWTQV